MLFRSIYFATRNEFFWPIAQMFEITLSPSLTIAATGDHRPRSLVEHRDVVEAIERRDPEEARKAAVLLLQHSAADLVRIRGIDPFGVLQTAAGSAPLDREEATARSAAS